MQEGIFAYEQGDYFKAHELLEPAWMGTDDLAERALYQGLIKMAAGYVHAVRGNPIGLARNLRGAREHLATSLRLNPEIARAADIDLAALLARVDACLAGIAALAAEPAVSGAPLIDLVPKAPQIR
jgi:predicted metal-dependent hydrolase